MAKCGTCKKFMTPTRGLICDLTSCKAKNYHRECVGMTASSKIISPWICPPCKETIPRGSNAPAGDAKDCSGIAADPELISMLRQVREEIGSLRAEITEFREEMKDIRVEITACNRSMATISGQVDAIDEKVNGLEEKINCNTNAVTLVTQRLDNIETRLKEAEAKKQSYIADDHMRELEATIAQLRTELNDKEQDSLINDLEISGLPEQENENTVHIVRLIAAKIGVTIDDRDVVEAWRAGPKRLNAALPAAPAESTTTVRAPRARPLVVRCARRSIRDALLRAARVRRTLKTRDLTLPGDSSVYINERLTRVNRHLFGKTKEMAKTYQWKYVWSYNGRILARKAVGLSAHRISCEADLNSVFCSSSTADCQK